MSAQYKIANWHDRRTWFLKWRGVPGLQASPVRAPPPRLSARPAQGKPPQRARRFHQSKRHARPGRPRGARLRSNPHRKEERRMKQALRFGTRKSADRRRRRGRWLRSRTTASPHRPGPVFAVALMARPDLQHADEQRLVAWLESRKPAADRPAPTRSSAHDGCQPGGAAGETAGCGGLLAQQEVPSRGGAGDALVAEAYEIGGKTKLDSDAHLGHHGRGVELQSLRAKPCRRTGPDAGHDPRTATSMKARWDPHWCSTPSRTCASA